MLFTKVQTFPVTPSSPQKKLFSISHNTVPHYLSCPFRCVRVFVNNGELCEVCGQQFSDLSTDGSGRILQFSRRFPTWHHVVSIHLRNTTVRQQAITLYAIECVCKISYNAQLTWRIVFTVSHFDDSKNLKSTWF